MRISKLISRPLSFRVRVSPMLTCGMLLALLHLAFVLGSRASDGVAPLGSSVWPRHTLQPSEVVTYHVFLPLVARFRPCQPIPGAQYGQLSISGDPTDRPAESHPDLNLAIRGYEPTQAYLGLVDYGGEYDPRAPQLYGLFADKRTATFVSAYKVYDWDWDCDCRGGLITDWDVTLAGLKTTPGETIHVPDSGYEIGQGYEVLVLYAEESRITLKYTREDSVLYGYTIHLEDICVDPNLLALYRSLNEAGRSSLPALRAGQAFAMARNSQIKVAIRDYGRFMDPRSRKDWWQGR